MVELMKRFDIIERIGFDFEYGYSETRKALIISALVLLLFVSIGVAITFGAYSISIFDVYRIVLAHLSPFGDMSGVTKLHNTIVWELRIPRVLLAVTVGTALATAGAVFQGCFRNPLVEPYILGISSGAAFGAAMGIVFSDFVFSIQLSAFIFGSLAVALSYFLARVRKETPIVTLILAGVIVGSIFSAMVSILKYIATDTALREIVFWLMGGFYYARWDDVRLLVPIIIPCFLVMWSLGWKLNILSMGDEEARALGVNPEKYKLILIALATLVTSLAVSTVGIIAWVGLMMPHASRMMLGPDHRYVIPASAMLGGTYLLVCDTMARTLTTAEIPVGIITSILGAPYLFYLLRTRGKAMLG